MEAGMENYDTAMVAVGVGGAVAGAALTKIAPEGAKRTIKRAKSYTRKRVEKFEEKYPCPFKTILFFIAAVNLALYYSDVYSDGEIIINIVIFFTQLGRMEIDIVIHSLLKERRTYAFNFHRRRLSIAFKFPRTLYRVCGERFFLYDGAET